MQNHLRDRLAAARASRGRRGFTLIELLAVILIISILATFLVPRIPEFFDAAEVTACSKNLSDIYSGFMTYELKYRGESPDKGGVRFFASLIYRDVWENTPAAAKKLTCPAVKISALEINGLEPEEWFHDPELITGGFSSYAGRDLRNFPLRRLKTGKEPLVCDDNDPELNHMTTTLVLYGDGSVQPIELATLREKGLISVDEKTLLVGPDSPVEDLRKFSLD